MNYVIFKGNKIRHNNTFATYIISPFELRELSNQQWHQYNYQCRLPADGESATKTVTSYNTELQLSCNFFWKDAPQNKLSKINRDRIFYFALQEVTECNWKHHKKAVLLLYKDLELKSPNDQVFWIKTADVSFAPHYSLADLFCSQWNILDNELDGKLKH